MLISPSETAGVTLRPVSTADITGGFWARRRHTNAFISIKQGPARLESSGNLDNFRRAATGDGEFSGDFQFQDSDAYKWLEAACWQSADDDCPPELAADIERIVALVSAAQQPDGYLQTYYQLGRGTRWTELGWGHELYCAGHLIQAAIAHRRVTGKDSLLRVALRLADHIDAVFGQGGQVDGVCGHPQIETALVELYRETNERRYLRLAAYFVDRRGTGTLSAGVDRGHDRDPGPAFWQDHIPVRDADAVAGHAVRQLYLLAGAADVATETGDTDLHEATVRLWQDMAATKTYITGGVGARHDWEAFGDPYELPSDRSYAETCAAIASIHFSWRLALATGHARYSDLIERTLYNGFLAGVGLDGDQWLYVNPLQVRASHTDRPGDQGTRRTAWFRCACCPPNAMRLLAGLPYFCATTDPDGMQLHQFATGVYGDGDMVIGVETDYPWNGGVRVVIQDAPAAQKTLSLRIPGWCTTWSCELNGEEVDAMAEDGWLRTRREWKSGDTLVLNLNVQPRLTDSHPRVDATRGCAAIEYGPVVYCLEQADQPLGADLEDVVLDRFSELREKHDPRLLGGVTTIEARVRTHQHQSVETWPPAGPAEHSPDGALTVTAVPYALWANREHGAMRVWIPVAATQPLTQ